MAKIFNQNIGVDQTVRIFDNFYKFDLVINSSEFDIVRSYFVSVCDTTAIAENFTTYLFKIAQQTGIDALTLLDYIQGKTKLDMNKVISYYLNSFKSKTSLYGVSYIPAPNQAVARNIVQ